MWSKRQRRSRCSCLKLENMLVVKESWLETNKNNLGEILDEYIYILEGDRLVKRRVIRGPATRDKEDNQVCIILGLSEGD